ncbi:MAG: CinA family protein [Corynebacterium sp.]|nr:CinA family protein [Corynebacterium sp.]
MELPNLLDDLEREAHAKAASVISSMTDAGFSLATCESLTAGLAASTLASVPGASKVLRGGFVTYATELKYALVGVTEGLDPITEQCAKEMASGARARTESDFALSFTGVAGPDLQDGHPVGEIWLGCAGPSGVEAINVTFDRYDGSTPADFGRQGLRLLSCIQGYDLLLARISGI